MNETRRRDDLLPSRPKTLPRRLPIAPDAPALVPARMLNELMYCERLVYLEWAQGEFQENVFTTDGRVVHRRVDARRGTLPEPDVDEEPDASPPWQARSVELGSERLGIIARIDLVEGEGGFTIPVETKRGRAPAIREGAYLPERVQVCAHVLLLREHGYVTPHAEIWFAADRRRVTIVIDDWLIEQTTRAVARVRALGEAGELPPPLDDSPKCKGCSLVGICLPDEVSLLRGLRGEPVENPGPGTQLTLDDMFRGSDATGPMERDPWGLVGELPALTEDEAIRRVHPARDERTAVYVSAQGARIGVDGETLRIEANGGATTARLPQTSHVAVFGNVQVSTQALAALFDRDIPMMFFSTGGWLRGRTVSHGSKNIELRIAQFSAATDTDRALEVARTFVAAKIRNQRTMLRRNGNAVPVVTLNQLESLAKKAEQVSSVEALLGIEGTAARDYFGAFKTMLKGTAAEGRFDLEGRNRRPPKDPINALLSLGYALLTKDVVAACLAAGLEPLLGFLHKPRYGRPAMALDLMEEMRPLVADSTVVNALNTGVVTIEDFVVAPTGCSLTAAGRRRFIESYERRVDQLVTHPVFGYRLSYRRVFDVQARLLGRWLLDEIDSYPPFRTR